MSDNDKLAIQDGQTVVFIGDSLTDCGRREEAAPLGAGYVSMAVALTTGVLGGIYPAWQATRMRPVEALRYE